MVQSSDDWDFQIVLKVFELHHAPLHCPGDDLTRNGTCSSHLLSLDEACGLTDGDNQEGLYRWGNGKSRTTYVICWDEPWKKETVRSWCSSLFPSFTCFFSFGAWEWHHICFHCKATSFDTALLFLAWTPVLRLIQTELAHSTILTKTGWTIVATCSLGTWNCVHNTVKCVLLLRVCMF